MAKIFRGKTDHKDGLSGVEVGICRANKKKLERIQRQAKPPANLDRGE